VFVCENPTVIAAAANLLGTKCLPIVCINGQPKTAARILLNRLREAGVKLAYHGDFDWPGIQIANLIMKRHGAVPLRMSCADYLAATLPFADKTASDQPKRSRLEGEPVTAIWDAGLTSAMLDHDQAIHEEQVLDLLLAELTRQPEAPRRG